jgi:ABC-type nitrate/sulfonate/bicarbonate transport system permease component
MTKTRPASSWVSWLAVRIGVLSVLIVLWAAAIHVFGIPSYLLPTPASVARAAALHPALLAERAGYTLGSAMLGLLISTVLAGGLAVAFLNSRLLARASMPLVVAFRSAPVAAIAPLVMLMTGRGLGTSVVVVTIVSFFPLYVNLMRGLGAPDRNTVELMRVTGATRWQQLRLLRIPYAMPFLFTGLRVAGGTAILGAMLSEWLTGAPGLGMLILDSGDMRQTELLWAATILSVFVALCVFWSTSLCERNFLSWRR